MRCHRINRGATVFCSVLVLLGWHTPPAAAAAPVKTVIGYATVTARLMPLWLAHEQGIFAKYGVDAQPILIRGAPTLVAGLASGDIQIGRTGGSAMLAAVAAGHDFKFVASFSSRNTYDLVVRPKICAANVSRSPASAVPHGWAFSCGLNTSG
jgi:ABC-type nitrate/sulfonate/bicarbonate transport system substrate-binding protein